jgi:hypothetical protein
MIFTTYCLIIPKTPPPAAAQRYNPPLPRRRLWSREGGGGGVAGGDGRCGCSGSATSSHTSTIRPSRRSWAVGGVAKLLLSFGVVWGGCLRERGFALDVWELWVTVPLALGGIEINSNRLRVVTMMEGCSLMVNHHFFKAVILNSARGLL